MRQQKKKGQDKIPTLPKKNKLRRCKELQITKGFLIFADRVFFSFKNNRAYIWVKVYFKVYEILWDKLKKLALVRPVSAL